eukprot:TRINITY_DN46529_c0_g1_i1.p2 TRINITY_DN46529_c0_g1~~TRINITY_DN46529_c0_g1_i1.p2  ORF type:complete len:138 (+),score=30.83 TRINITY_DN46529_c0_g1_i1:41-454(+)
MYWTWFVMFIGIFFFQAEDGIRDVERSRGLGDVYKRQVHGRYIVLDGDELKVGFALFKTEEEETEIWLSIIIISAVIFIILIIAGIILAKKLMRKKSRKFITRRKQYKFYLEKVYKIFGNLLLLFNSETSRLNANDI